MTVRRFSIAAAMIAVVATATTPIASAGFDQSDVPPPGLGDDFIPFDQPDTEREARQDQMHSVVDPLLNDLASRVDIEDYFLDIYADPDMRSAKIMWRGDVPTWVPGYLDSSRNTFPVTIEPALFSLTDLHETTDAVVEAWDDSWGTLAGVGVADDYSGADVVYTPSTSKTARSSQATPDREKLAEAMTIPLAGIETSDPVIPAAWRGNDSSPWSPGGRLRYSSQSPLDCSAGFGLVLQNGSQRLMTAGHCGSVGSTVRDGAYDLIGDVAVNRYTASGDNFGDVSLIAATASDDVFVGSWDNTNGPRRDLIGWGWSATNDEVCTNGSNSGEHCYLTVGTPYDVPYSNGRKQATRRATHQSTNGVAAVRGDSGGPVITRGASQARAYGMIVAISNEDRNCVEGDTCRFEQQAGRTVFYTPIGNLLSTSFWGQSVDLKTW